MDPVWGTEAKLKQKRQEEHTRLSLVETGYGSSLGGEAGECLKEVGGYGNVNPNYNPTIIGRIFGDTAHQKYSTIFDEVAATSITGSKRIFHGRYHELHYPPPAHM